MACAAHRVDDALKVKHPSKPTAQHAQHVPGSRVSHLPLLNGQPRAQLCRKPVQRRQGQAPDDSRWSRVESLADMREAGSIIMDKFTEFCFQRHKHSTVKADEFEVQDAIVLQLHERLPGGLTNYTAPIWGDPTHRPICLPLPVTLTYLFCRSKGQCPAHAAPTNCNDG